MLKLHRILITIATLTFISNAFALTVNNYVTNSYNTLPDNTRVVDILNRPGAVIFETQTLESPDISEVCVSTDNYQHCSDDPLSEPALIGGIGYVSTDSEKNIIFTPLHPEFVGRVSFTYQVVISRLDLVESATLSIIINRNEIELGTNRGNLDRISDALGGLCSTAGGTPGDKLASACLAFASLGDEAQITALNTISPEEVAAEFTSTLNMTKNQTTNLSNRLNSLRSGATGVNVAGLTYIQGNDRLPGSWLHEMANQMGGNAGADNGFSPIGFFINGSISSGDKDTTTLEQGYDLEGDSITLGMDYRFDETLVAGVAYGISNNEIEFSQTNQINNEINYFQFYGTWYKDAFYVDAVVGYAQGDINTDRRINFTGTSGSSTVVIDEVVQGKTESSQILLSLAGSYGSAIIGRFVLDTSDSSAFSIQADDLDESWFQLGVGVSATFQHGLSAYIDYETIASYNDTQISTYSFGGRWEATF